MSQTKDMRAVLLGNVLSKEFAQNLRRLGEDGIPLNENNCLDISLVMTMILTIDNGSSFLATCLHLKLTICFLCKSHIQFLLPT